jgi:triosephosphate isomerase (TIM)
MMKLFSMTLLATAASAFTPSQRLTSPSQATTTALEMAGRKPFISGNWKLNPQTKEEATSLASGIAKAITYKSPDADFALFVPYVFIDAAMQASKGKKLTIGAEVCVYKY